MTDNPASPGVALDTRGTFCPVPIIKLSEAIRNVDAGVVVEITSDDPAIAFDLPAWCAGAGHSIVSREVREGVFVFRVRKEDG